MAITGTHPRDAPMTLCKALRTVWPRVTAKSICSNVFNLTYLLLILDREGGRRETSINQLPLRRAPAEPGHLCSDLKAALHMGSSLRTGPKAADRVQSSAPYTVGAHCVFAAWPRSPVSPRGGGPPLVSTCWVGMRSQCLPSPKLLLSGASGSPGNRARPSARLGRTPRLP